MTYAFVPPARKARTVFGFKMPDFFTRSAKEPYEYGERGRKTAADETKVLQAGRRGAAAVLLIRNNNHRKAKDGRKANLLRIYRMRKD